MTHPRPLRPDRLRTLERPFGWIPFRILTSGLLQQLSREAKLLYFFLCLVADGQGISFYGDRRLQLLLDLSDGELEHARAELCRQDLLAFDGRVYQLLSLPARRSSPSGQEHRSGHRRVLERRSSPRRSSSPVPLGEILRGLELVSRRPWRDRGKG